MEPTANANTNANADAENTARNGEAARGKSFKVSADIENFFRFVSDNDLRREAKMIFQALIGAIKKGRKSQKARTRSKGKSKVQ